MKWFACAALAAMSIVTPARAGYLGERAHWDKLPDSAKAVYAMGVFDAANILFGGDSKETRALKQGRVRCIADEVLMPPRLAALVDAAYAADPTRASQPPSTVLIGQVSAHCERHIKEERLKLGN
jgi:hypothetical protein